jgi:hypothetical protein
MYYGLELDGRSLLCDKQSDRIKRIYCAHFYL